MQKKFASFLAIPLALGLALPAHAAFINIDDTDPTNITLTAGDFENGISINGTLLTIGLGNHASITLADGTVNTISGSWIDDGFTAPGQKGDILFADAGNPAAVTSGLSLTGSTDGFFGSISGSFEGYTGVPFFTTVEATNPQEGPAVGGSYPFLSLNFTPEHVPDAGSTLALFGMAVTGLGLFARRNRA